MKISTISSLAGAAMMAFSVFTANAQSLKTPQPSPMQTVKQAFGVGDVTIEYSRPGVKGRVIFGDIVPFGKIWRTGANSTTKITFSEDVKLEGNAVKAGTYGLYTIPNADSWDIMLTKDLSLGGNVADYKTSDEVLRFKVKPTVFKEKVGNLMINIDEITATSAQLFIAWDKTMVTVNMTTDIDEKIMKNIEANMKVDSRPYFQAATYYYDNGKDMNQALTWVNKAIEANDAFYVLHLKAKIQLKLKDKKGAIETAKLSLAKSKEAKNDDWVKINEKFIEAANKS